MPPGQRFDARGLWAFSGSLTLNECGLDVPFLFDAAVYVYTQSGATILGQIGTIAATGNVDEIAEEWTLLGATSCDAITLCCSASGFRAYELGNSVPAGFVLSVACPGGLTCNVGYLGTARR